MKKLFLHVIMLTAVGSTATAQYTNDWTQSCGIYNQTAVMSAIDNNDNLVVTGYFQSENIYTRKYDITGDFLWETSDGSGLAGKYEKPLWILADAENNVIVIGKRYSISSFWEYPDAMIAIKYSPSGDFLWKQEIPVTVLIGSQHPDFNLRAAADSEGNLYIGTVAASPSGFVLSKIDPSGNILFTNNTNVVPVNGFWSMRMGEDRIVISGGGYIQAPVSVWDLEGSLLWTSAPEGRGAKDVEFDGEGNLYLLTSYSNQVSSTSGEDMVLYKYNSTGEQLWKKDFDMGGYEYSSRLVYTPGRLSITGYGYPAGSIYFDWKTLQVNTDGTLLWSAVYDGTAFNDEYPNYISAKAQGDVFITGAGGPSPDPGNLSAMQMVILQYSNTGSVIWTDTPNPYGGWGLACQLASDNSLFAISSAEMTVYHYMPPVTTNYQTPITEAKVKIGPVPASDVLWIRLNRQEPGAFVEIHDQGGRMVRTAALTAEINEISMNSLDPGLYICHIFTGSFQETHKIIKH